MYLVCLMYRCFDLFIFLGSVECCFFANPTLFSLVSLINQCLVTLTEFCQGPCRENQQCITMGDTNGIAIVLALVVADLTQLASSRVDLVVELKGTAVILLLSMIESGLSAEMVDRINLHLDVKQMLSVLEWIYEQNLSWGVQPGAANMDASDVNTVGHNLYILLYTLADNNAILAAALRTPNPSSQSLAFYPSHTGHVEIARHSKLEKICFPIPDICHVRYIFSFLFLFFVVCPFSLICFCLILLLLSLLVLLLVRYYSLSFFLFLVVLFSLTLVFSTFFVLFVVLYYFLFLFSLLFSFACSPFFIAPSLFITMFF